MSSNISTKTIHIGFFSKESNNKIKNPVSAIDLAHYCSRVAQTKNNKSMNLFTACNTYREHVGFVNANASVFSLSLDCMETVVIDMCKGSREAF